MTAAVVVAFDRDDEGGEVAVADDLPKLAFGFEHAGGGPAQRHLAGGPALDVALGASDDLDHRLAWVRALERALQVAGDAEPAERERLLHLFAQRAGGAGVAAVELRGERSQLIERAAVVVERPRAAQPLLHARPVALGEVVGHVALLVPHASLHGRPAEDVADRLAERLGAVDHEQDPLLGVEATLDQVREQRGRDGRVLRASFPEPDTDAEREQSLLRSADQLPERLLNALRQHDLLRARLRERYVPVHGGSSSDLGRIASNAPNSSGRGRRDRRQVLRATGQPPVR